MGGAGVCLAKALRTLALWMLPVFLCTVGPLLWAKDPKTNYMVECQGCHLADGSGGLANIPALKNHVATFLAVPGGREYIVQVPGVALSSLSDRDITDVLNWMLNEFGPTVIAGQYPPYTVEEVAHLRQQPLTEITRKRAELVTLMKQPAVAE